MPGFSSYGAGVGNYGANLFQAPDTTQREVMGSVIQAADPVWGGAEFIYAKAAGAIRAAGAVQLVASWDTALGGMRLDATELANATNSARTVAVALAPMAAGTYGYFAIQGTLPVNSVSSVAAGSSMGSGNTGQLYSNTAGKQILNAVCSVPATQTVAKNNCTAANASTVLQVPNSDGWFVGAFLSGTGITAGTTVAGIDASGRFVTLSTATNAAVNGTVTATYNNGSVFYNVVTFNRPFAQGAIT